MNPIMNRRNFVVAGAAVTVAGLTGNATASVTVQEGAKIALLPPNQEGGMPLQEALAKRKTTRLYQEKMLDLQTLSDLLWSANGINRADGRRTAPSALNSQEILPYVMLKNGVYRYLPAENVLERVAEGDFRKLAGNQEYTHTAPVTLIYVADLNLSKVSSDAVDTYAAVNCGFVGQNVYLFATSVGLASVFRGSIDRPALAKLLKLADQQVVLYAQTIGYADEEKVMASPIRLK